VSTGSKDSRTVSMAICGPTLSSGGRCAMIARVEATDNCCPATWKMSREGGFAGDPGRTRAVVRAHRAPNVANAAHQPPAGPPPFLASPRPAVVAAEGIDREFERGIGAEIPVDHPRFLVDGDHRERAAGEFNNHADTTGGNLAGRPSFIGPPPPPRRVRRERRGEPRSPPRPPRSASRTGARSSASRFP
jgi:hypothetical protein